MHLLMNEWLPQKTLQNWVNLLNPRLALLERLYSIYETQNVITEETTRNDLLLWRHIWEIILQYNLLKPGTVHKARWIGEQLYSYKIVVLRNNIPLGTATKVQINKLQCIVNICWFQCPLTISAPILDMEFIRNMNGYRAMGQLQNQH